MLSRGEQLHGLVTDRDLTLRVLADGRDPAASRRGDICSRDPVTVRPGDDIAKVAELACPFPAPSACVSTHGGDRAFCRSEQRIRAGGTPPGRDRTAP